jgi:hypothetical protein
MRSPVELRIAFRPQFVGDILHQGMVESINLGFSGMAAVGQEAIERFIRRYVKAAETIMLKRD